MTNAQMKAALRQMSDFFVACVKAQEILESAEAAEATIKSLEPEKAAAIKEMETIKEQVAEHRKKLADVASELAQAKAEAASEQSAVRSATAEAQAKLKKAKEALDETEKAHANRMAEQTQAIQRLQDVLDDKRKQLEDFRRAIPA